MQRGSVASVPIYSFNLVSTRSSQKLAILKTASPAGPQLHSASIPLFSKLSAIMILTTFVFLTVLACTLVCSSAFIHGPRFLRPRRQAFRRRRPVLILCSSECGCVTESGQTLICPFIEDTEALTILRANRLSRTTYRALRQITVGSFVITGASASSGTCPSSAGSPPPARGDRCFAAPRPARGEQAPVNRNNFV